MPDYFDRLVERARGGGAAARPPTRAPFETFEPPEPFQPVEPTDGFEASVVDDAVHGTSGASDPAVRGQVDRQPSEGAAREGGDEVWSREQPRATPATRAAADVATAASSDPREPNAPVTAAERTTSAGGVSDEQPPSADTAGPDTRTLAGSRPGRSAGWPRPASEPGAYVGPTRVPPETTGTRAVEGVPDAVAHRGGRAGPATRLDDGARSRARPGEWPTPTPTITTTGSSPQTVVRVSIGRVEIRAPAPAPAPVPTQRADAATPHLTLDAYLERVGQRRRR